MNIINTIRPYKTLSHRSIDYGVCRDFNHICRYKGLRQITHNFDGGCIVSLESINPFHTSVEVIYHDVTPNEENRLDLLADKYLGSSTYSWVIAYLNNIQDGFTVHPGQRIMIPKQFTSLFNSGEILAPISALVLNLGSE